MQQVLKRLDLFPKTNDEHRKRTLSGATVSLISLGVFAFLFLVEFAMFLSTDLHQELLVDSSLDNQLEIQLDITFPKLPCSYLSLDAVDASGASQLDLHSQIYTQRLDRNGRFISTAESAKLESEIQKEIVKVTVPQNGNGCASCYGAENDKYKCCETCEDVREAYRDKGWAFTTPADVAQCHNEGFTKKLTAQKHEGCRVYGSLTVSKTEGNVHISPGRSIRNSHSHVHDTAMFGIESFNLTHRIDHLSFGADFPGRTNPLDGINRVSEAKNSLFQYFVKVVPTVYEYSGGTQIHSSQFSVTHHSKPLSDAHDDSLPGVFFLYDSSPIQVVLKETSQSFAKFLTALSATAGGIFTISTLIDRAMYTYSTRKKNH